jgi:hypothetical protein
MDSLTLPVFPTLPEEKPQPTGGRDVEKVNSYSFYEMAREFRQLHALPDNVTASNALFPIINARARILTLLNEGKPIPLGVCRPNALALYNAVNELFDSFSVDDGEGGKKFDWPKEDTPFPSWRLNVYRNALDTFETVFSAEMGETATYFVPRRGIFNTAALVDNADEAFPQEIRGCVPQKSRDDWRAAGRCLAFNLLSASGFHVARAVEGTIESYYQTFTGKSGTLKGWHDYIEALEKASGPSLPTAKTISEIKQMKDDYRNPLMHPRVVLSEPEARILFDNGESLIMAMAGEIKGALLARPPTLEIIDRPTDETAAGKTEPGL